MLTAWTLPMRWLTRRRTARMTTTRGTSQNLLIRRYEEMWQELHTEKALTNLAIMIKLEDAKNNQNHDKSKRDDKSLPGQC